MLQNIENIFFCTFELFYTKVKKEKIEISLFSIFAHYLLKTKH